MKLFHECIKCHGNKFKLSGATKNEKTSLRTFTVKCSGCGEIGVYSVEDADFMNFIMCPEIITVFGKNVFKKKQEELW